MQPVCYWPSVHAYKCWLAIQLSIKYYYYNAVHEISAISMVCMVLSRTEICVVTCIYMYVCLAIYTYMKVQRVFVIPDRATFMCLALRTRTGCVQKLFCPMYSVDL